MDNVTTTRNGQSYTTMGLVGWYVSHPIRNGDRLEIARIDAIKDGLRYPTKEEADRLQINPYHSAPEYTGKPVTCWLQLTAEEIVELGLMITGTNPTGRRESSPAEVQAVVDRLCNEGH